MIAHHKMSLQNEIYIQGVLLQFLALLIEGSDYKTKSRKRLRTSMSVRPSLIFTKIIRIRYPSKKSQTFSP